MIVEPEIDGYLDSLAYNLEPDPVLEKMEAMAKEEGFPIVGPQVGRVLHFLAASIGARRVLELGSGFGYSALWFARAVGEGGKVVLTDFSQERLDKAQGFLEKAGLGDRIEAVYAGDACQTLAALEGPFDVVFNDIDKELYPRIAARSAVLLRHGGLLISDNMLWDGKVLDKEPDAPTRGVLELTQMLHSTAYFETMFLPVRDGLSVSRRL